MHNEWTEKDDQIPYLWVLKEYKISKWRKYVFPSYQNTKRFQLKSYKSMHKDNIKQEWFISVQLISQEYYICSHLQNFNLITEMIQRGGGGKLGYNTLALHGNFFFRSYTNVQKSEIEI